VPGYELFESARDALGLYFLRPLRPQEGLDAREATGMFWRAVFGWLLGAWGEAPARAAWDALVAAQPKLGAPLARGLAALAATLRKDARANIVPDTRYALGFAPCLRPLAGFFERVLQNGDGGAPSRLRCLSLLERVAALAAHA
jgi:hypothetical protein